MNPTLHDVVLVTRGRKMLPRIGRVVKLGRRKVHVRFGRQRKRYALSSLTVLLRTGVRVRED